MGKHFRFVHCADLHLGAPFRGIQSGDKGPWTDALEKATFRAFENVVDWTEEIRADALIIAGDVYNSNEHSLSAQLSFARELYRLAQAGIPVFMVHGNHDPGDAWKADIPLPPSVHVFSSEEAESFPLMKDGELAATIYGMSYGTQHETENLALRFHRKQEDSFAIGVLHTEMGSPGNPYAPCSLEDLRGTGMDYWALGHIHTRRVAGEKPYIVYPGNTQGLDPTETGPKGCYAVDVGTYGTVTLSFKETDVVRWLDMNVDITDIQNQDELVRNIMKRRASLRELTGKPNLVRLIFTGRGPVHRIITSREGQDFILQSLNAKEQFRHIFSYFFQVEDRTLPLLDLEERSQLPDMTGDYLRACRGLVDRTSDEQEKAAKEILEKRPEWAQFGRELPYFSGEELMEVMKKAEIKGAEMLSEGDENEDH